MQWMRYVTLFTHFANYSYIDENLNTMENNETNRLLKSINDKLGFFTWLTVTCLVGALGIAMMTYL